jgi:hypothetical protein
VRGRAIFVMLEGHRPHLWHADRCSIHFENPANYETIGEHIVIVIIPYARWPAGAGALQDQCSFRQALEILQRRYQNREWLYLEKFP